MRASEKLTRPPMVLIANDQEWTARSLESILGPSGYAVLRAYTGRQALELARTTQPDLVVLDERMPDMSGTEVCRLLRDDPRFGEHTPIIITTADAADREQRITALRAGAWEHFGEPFDSEMLLVKLETFIRAKRAVDRAQEESLVDPATGLYNVRGLARRAREIGADATRHGSAVACVALAPEESPGAYSDKVMEEIAERIVRHLAEIIRREGRVSDAIGRLGPQEFAIVAPGTEAGGAVQLIERLRLTIEREPLDLPHERRHIRVRSGFYAVPDFAAAAIDPVEMMVRAAGALRQSRVDADAGVLQ